MSIQHLFVNENQKLTALVPALDNLTLANVEAQRLASVVAGIELLATILEGTTVVNLNLVACCAFHVSICYISSMIPSPLLTNLSLAGTFNGRVDLDVERLVQSRSCGGEECQCTGQSNKLHFDFMFWIVVIRRERLRCFGSWRRGSCEMEAQQPSCTISCILHSNARFL